MKAIRVYSQVLVDAAQGNASSGGVEAALASLKNFETMMNESPLLKKAMLSQSLAEDEKVKAIDALAARASLTPFAVKYLHLLARKNRVALLPEIFKAVEAIQVEKAGGLVGELVSAVPLAVGVKDGVAAALSKKLNRPVNLKEKIDPELIAGMRVTVSGVTFDGSLKNKIEKLTASFR